MINFGVKHTTDISVRTIFSLQPQLDVQLVATKSALHFFDPTSLPVKCHIDEEEWVRITVYCCWLALGPAPSHGIQHDCVQIIICPPPSHYFT